MPGTEPQVPCLLHSARGWRISCSALVLLERLDLRPISEELVREKAVPLAVS